MLAFLHALIKVNEDLKTIGALAGFVAIPGLAVLSLLYFGQAREVRRLREWAGRAPERAAELEQRVTADAQRRVQGQPLPRPATQAATPAGQASTGNGAAQAKPAEPATVAAQAAAAPAEAKPEAPATGEGAEAKPASEQEGGEEAKPEEGKPDEGAKAPAADATPEAPAAPKPGSPEAAPPPDTSKPAAPAASAAPSASPPAPKDEPAAPGASTPSPEPAVPAASTAAGAAAARPGADRPRSPAPPVPPRPAQPLRATSPSATIPPRPAPAARRDDGAPGRFAGRRGIVAAGVAVAVLAIGAAVIARVVAGDGGEQKTPPAPNTLGQAPSPAAQPSSPGAPPARTKAQRAQTSVAVLNGTTVTGLARSVANRLEEQGFTTVAVTDASNQAQSDTKVEFTAGHREEALDAARSLRVPASQVVAASDVDSTTAGPNAEVVVVVGQNFAR